MAVKVFFEALMSYLVNIICDFNLSTICTDEKGEDSIEELSFMPHYVLEVNPFAMGRGGASQAPPYTNR